MKSHTHYIILLLLLALNSQAQLSGRITLFEKGEWSMISVNEKIPYITTKGDGNFSIDLPEKLNKVFFLESGISIEIVNIPKNVKANLGNLEIPMRKSLSFEEYEKSTDEEKKMIIPVHCYTQLLGYEYLDKLENPKIIFTCNNVKFELDKFEFNVKEQKVIIDWKNLRLCVN